MNNFKDYELNQYGLLVFKHKTNKRLFLQRSYHWKDRLTLIDETEGRDIVMDFPFSTFDFYAWEPMTKEEYDSVKYNFKEIYEQSLELSKNKQLWLEKQNSTSTIALK